MGLVLSSTEDTGTLWSDFVIRSSTRTRTTTRTSSQSYQDSSQSPKSSSQSPKNVKGRKSSCCNEKAVRITALLDSLYPDPPVPLDHLNDFTFLVAVVLSAQTTDGKVTFYVTSGDACFYVL
ncbi:hypothetical protein B484DRAFT_425679 [Ochromonadaceae sp. CCMP2298]|nr:hypothetical protein B484DRAFT_425679 [Ochromonadaceae sp. CCMP2298]